MNTGNGRFVWFDLFTNDVQAAKAFYSELVGWKTTPFGGGGNYEIWNAGETMVGGIGKVAATAKPSWLGYVANDDLDGTVRRTERMRGKVIVAPTDIPDTGRYAVLADPMGAAFGVFSAKGEPRSSTPRAPGHFSWSELNTTDFKAAWQFYSELFGWKHNSSLQMGGEVGEYFMFGTDPKEAFGGMSNYATAMKTTPHWLHYVTVPNTDEAAKKVGQGKGTVMNGPMEVPGGGRIAVCLDPQGAIFGLFSPP
jgi:uncharacterized protein